MTFGCHHRTSGDPLSAEEVPFVGHGCGDGWHDAVAAQIGHSDQHGANQDIDLLALPLRRDHKSCPLERRQHIRQAYCGGNRQPLRSGVVGRPLLRKL